MNNVIVPLANHNTGKVRGLQGMNGTCVLENKSSYAIMMDSDLKVRYLDLS